MKEKNRVEEIIEEFDNKFNCCTEVGGFHSCVLLKDKDEQSSLQKRIRIFLSTSLTSAFEAGKSWGEYSGDYVRGYGDGIKAEQSRWMKQSDGVPYEKFKEEFQRGYFYGEQVEKEKLKEEWKKELISKLYRFGGFCTDCRDRFKDIIINKEVTCDDF